MIRKLSRLPKNFESYPETFQVICKSSRLSWNFPDRQDTFQTIRKLSRLSGNFPDHPETFQTFWKLSRPSKTSQCNFKGYAQNISGRKKNFPDGNATMPRWFLCLCLPDYLMMRQTDIQVYAKSKLMGDLITHWCGVIVSSYCLD